MAPSVPELIRIADSWMQTDPDPVTRAATAKIIEAADPKELLERFGSRLEFGTAGLRGVIGPGPNAMNRALVRRVATGLATYLLEHVPDAADRGVVIGFDGRHGSLEFSEDTAAVLAAFGFRVWLSDVVLPTPRLAHAVPYLNACAGVMVTASHNPPADNGYKVYWGNGAQIVPPHDTGISDAIDALQAFDARNVEPLAPFRERNRVTVLPPQVYEDYQARVLALRVHNHTDLRIVYTAMHGVGTASVRRVLTDAGYTQLHLVALQAEPDGDFPTVAFPNPEEPGALDLSYALAREVGADIILANDPDADRLAVAVPDGDGWRQLTGNEVGCLLANDLLTRGENGPKPMVATTVVSSRMLRRIADHHGAAYVETLTGFKWIANAAIEHDAAGGRFVFGFEEALGYSAGDVARDKDGVSAVLLFADLAAWCKSNGLSVLDHLASLCRIHGLHTSLQHSVKLPGAEGSARIQQAMAALRADPPTEIDGNEVIAFTDLEHGTHLDLRTGATSKVDLPPSDVLAWSLADGSRVLARPSGTEPKIKFYGEVREPLGPEESLAEGETRSRVRVRALVDALVAGAGLA